MKTFSNCLKLWFEQYPSTSLRDLASEAEVTATDLSRIRAGDKDITIKALTKLLPAVQRLSTRSHARALLVAYLHDETPPDYEPDIRICAVDEDTGTIDLDAIAITRDRWEAKARSDAEFAKMWLTLDGYMHEPDASAVDTRISNLAFVAEPVTPYVDNRPTHTS